MHTALYANSDMETVNGNMAGMVPSVGGVVYSATVFTNWACRFS